MFADKGHCFITYTEKESVAKAVEGMKDAEVRKKLVEEAKEAQKEHKMNPLCAPHPQFYVRVPNPKVNKKKQAKQDDSDADSTTSSQDSTPFVEVTRAKPPSPPATPSPSSAPSVPFGRPARGAIPVPSAASPLADIPVTDHNIIPQRAFQRRIIPKPKKMPKAPKKVDLGDVNSFPTSTNVFGNLSDEEGELSD